MLTIEFKTDNAAFQYDDRAQICSALVNMVAGEILTQTGGQNREAFGKIRDINGNTVGFWALTKD